MRLKLTKRSRKELLLSLQPEYRESRWKEKHRLLDNFVTATGYNRKYATTLLNKDFSEESKIRKRKAKYGEDIGQALFVIWRKAANGICSKRLVPILPTLIDKMEEFGHLEITPDQKLKLCSLSPATVDRLLKPHRQKYGRGKSRTKPGYLIKRLIAVRTFTEWNEYKPGFIEADLVAHCGESVHGQFLHTLTMTDIETTWTEPVALLRRSESDVINALSQIDQLFPFPILGLDTDNGGEFINYALLGWCERNGITFTRSREYKKNDQAHVEEKNGSVVRRLIGYDRYEGIDSWKILSRLYSVARLYINFFQPTMKLLSKTRDGAYIYRKYDQARTPYARVLKCSNVPEKQKEKLRQEYKLLDPVYLLSEVERLQKEFWLTAINTKEQNLVELLPAVNQPKTKIAALGNLKSARPRINRKKSRVLNPIKSTSAGRKSTLDEVWPEVCAELNKNPLLFASDIFKLLEKRYPGRFRKSQISTIGDNLKRWRLIHYPEKNDCPQKKPGKQTILDVLWPEILVELEKNPNHTVRGLLAIFCDRYPGKVRMTQRSTLTKKLSAWRESHIQSISIFPEASISENQIPHLIPNDSDFNERKNENR